MLLDSAPSALTMMVTGGSRGLAQRTAHEGGVSPPQVTRVGPGRAVLGGDVRSHKTGQDGARCVPMKGRNERIPVFSKATRSVERGGRMMATAKIVLWRIVGID